jgi:hypothetical protein
MKEMKTNFNEQVIWNGNRQLYDKYYKNAILNTKHTISDTDVSKVKINHFREKVDHIKSTYTKTPMQNNI